MRDLSPSSLADLKGLQVADLTAFAARKLAPIEILVSAGTIVTPQDGFSYL